MSLPFILVDEGNGPTSMVKTILYVGMTIALSGFYKSAEAAQAFDCKVVGLKAITDDGEQRLTPPKVTWTVLISDEGVTIIPAGADPLYYACDNRGELLECARPNERVRFFVNRGVLTRETASSKGRRISAVAECESR